MNDPYRPIPTSTPQGYSDMPIRLLNGNRIVLQRTGRKTAVYQGETWQPSPGSPGRWNGMHPDGLWVRWSDPNDVAHRPPVKIPLLYLVGGKLSHSLDVPAERLVMWIRRKLSIAA